MTTTIQGSREAFPTAPHGEPTPEPAGAWQEDNRRSLLVALEDLVARLRKRAEAGTGGRGALGEARPEEGPRVPTLDALGDLFDLDPFERDLILLTAGAEMDGEVARLMGRILAGDGGAGGEEAEPRQPTLGLALELFPDASWEALAPSSPLRHWRLLELGSGPWLTGRPLSLDERILHYLLGIETVDTRLEDLLAPAHEPHGDLGLVPSQAALADRLAGTWERTAGTADFPALQLVGSDPAAKRAVAAGIAERLGLGMLVLPAASLPAASDQLGEVLRLWEREGALTRSLLLLDGDEVAPTDGAATALRRALDSVRGPLVLTAAVRRPPRQRPLLSVDVDKPTEEEQRALWRQVLAEELPELGVPADGLYGGEHGGEGGGEEGGEAGGLAASVAALVAQFNLGAPSIRAAWAGAVGELIATADEGGGAEGSPPTSEAIGRALWRACRTQARPHLESLARRIEPRASWADLVLPPAALGSLGQIVSQVRERSRVYSRWGFGGGSRGLGVSVLFTGLSGTGKTLAAEVLARDLEVDLYHIDLASVISKYIGETEKNLGRVFDAAEEGGAVLLFDEADALFGKRSEVKDSHDRYANIEVSYLLQRMEAHRGIAILTTNLRQALDDAFLRRLRFVVDFPFPDAEQRAEIWRRVFPRETPTAGLDVVKLARLGLAGGSIRNIALNAAFLAAGEGSPVTMGHLRRALENEYSKMGKPVPESEVRDW